MLFEQKYHKNSNIVRIIITISVFNLFSWIFSIITQVFSVTILCH